MQTVRGRPAPEQPWFIHRENPEDPDLYSCANIDFEWGGFCLDQTKAMHSIYKYYDLDDNPVSNMHDDQGPRVLVFYSFQLEFMCDIFYDC